MPESVSTEAPPLAQLKVGAKDGNSLDSLLDDHFDAVFSFFSRRVPSEEAQDLSAETFLAALQSKCPKNVDPICWLYGIARRKLADAQRKWRRDRSKLERFARYLEERPDNAEKTSVREIIEKLPDDQREALLLQALEELSLAEISVVMGRSQGSVKALLQRAKERVRKESGGRFAPEVEP